MYDFCLNPEHFKIDIDLRKDNRSKQPNCIWEFAEGGGYMEQASTASCRGGWNILNTFRQVHGFRGIWAKE